MCGICGWVLYSHGCRDDPNKIEEKPSVQRPIEVIEAMNATLYRRGPDEQNIWSSQDENCIFGHTRLIVVDPEGGKQPMSRLGTDGTLYTITYNGELYNTEDIRAELINAGHTFKSYSDTEVLLHAYMEWGSACLERLNGIFAFAIWSNRKLFFARDRVGVKPFFYSAFPKNFIFGSEVKALLEHPMVSRDVPFDALNTIFAVANIRPVGFVPFRDMHELKPGFAGTFSEEEGLKTWQYWHLSPNLTKDTVEEAANKIHALMKDASQRQTVSDVSCGALLSGGIDSTAIMHFAYDKIKSKHAEVQAFSLGLPEYSKYFQPSVARENNDEEYIQLACTEYALSHRWVTENSEDIISAVEAATIAKDYPIYGDLDATMLLLFKGIKPHATMVLSGEGADEIFGGYQHLYIDKFYPGIPTSTVGYQMLLRDELQDKLRLRSREIELYEACVKECPTSPEVEISEDEMEYRRRIYLSLTIGLQFMLERKDRLSMNSGVEVRVPFTDHRLIDYTFQIPKSYKMYDGVEKYVFRQSMALEETFPKEIRTRRKVPYPALVDPITLQLGCDLLQSILEDPSSEPIFQWFDKDKLKSEFESGFKSLGFNYAGLLTCINLYSLNFWFKHLKVNVVYN